MTDTVFENRVDLKGKFHNDFYYEILPLVRICEHLGGDALGFQYVGKQERYDGLILLKDGSKRSVEVTSAIDGYDDAKRMELLSLRGTAPVLQPIEATGSKRNRKFGENRTEFIASKDVDRSILENTISAIQKKCTMARSNPNYDGAWLGVVVEEHKVGFKTKQRLDQICAVAVAKQPINPFARVFFVGVSGNTNYLFDSHVN